MHPLLIQQLNIHKAEMEGLQKRMNNLKQKINSAITNMDSTTAPSSFAAFPTTALVKVTESLPSVSCGDVCVAVFP